MTIRTGMKLQRFIKIGLLIGIVSSANAQYKDDTDRYFEISKNMEIYNQIIKELNADYLEPIDPNRLLKVGVNAMLEDLDPYTVFYSETDVEDFRLESHGNIEALGISIINRDGVMMISDIQKGSPVIEQNIPIGSVILEVNGQDLKGKSEDEINTLFSSSSTIQLKIKDLKSQERTVNLSRKTTPFKTLRNAELLGKDKDIAYISLSQFMHSSDREILQALQEMKKGTSLKGVILDLRGNPGGLLDQAIKISNIFLPKDQLIVSTKGQSPAAESSLSTTRAPWDAEIPLVVLINHQSASASEIVSGTMQDLDRGVIVGAHSYGKGLVQHIRPLGYNTRLKLTTAQYFIPSGRSIQSIDYALKNEDGSVSHIPEERRKQFKTKNGRIVKDGGGINPDISIKEEQTNALLIALETHHVIFDFATKYFLENKEIASAKDFFITDKDWEAFKQFAKQHKNGPRILLGDTWEEWKKPFVSNNTNPKVLKALNNFEESIHAIQSSILEDEKVSLSYAISQEIVRRYEFEEGVQSFIFNHPNASLLKAIDLLENENEYKKLLKN
ncbi:MAG TPA: S41 family peptidase [Chitinophagaceae bacterium]|nr:S41 family peptidase [Chitinophagaceae bacterium]